MPKSLLNNRYGKLTVTKYLGNKQYLCKCDCGNEVVYYSTNLHGDLSCNDCKKGYRVDLSGKVYGLLTVVSYNKVSKKWLCKCKCGDTIEVKSNNLKSGNTLSCGKCRYVIAANNDIVNGTRVSQINKKTSKRSSTGVVGVSYVTRKNKYKAEIMFCGRRYYLGYYSTLQEASEVRKLAEEKLHGDFLSWLYDTYPEKYNNISKRITS